MISLIVAMDRNRVIGVDNTLPWHLPADLKRFKELTMGHHMIMGRKTFESIGKALPGRTTVIVTRNAAYAAPAGCLVAHSLDEALVAASADSEVFVIGGGELFTQALPIADTLYITELDLAVERGDSHFPDLDRHEWKLVDRQEHAPDEKNRHPYAFLTYEKKI